MQPRDLNEAMFRTYGPLAQKLACDHLALLRNLPLVLAAVLLREIIVLDTSFPPERSAMEAQLTFLSSLSANELHKLTQGFAGLTLSPELTARDWVRSPGKFEEDLSAYLWASHQIDSFHTLATQFVDAVRKATPVSAPAAPRWAVVVLSAELRKDGYPLFRKLQPHGVLFSSVSGNDGTAAILRRLAKRAAETPVSYGHWYIDGGNPLPVESNGISAFSWSESSPVREALLRKITSVLEGNAAGPEMLRSMMAEWTTAEWTQGESARATRDPLVEQFIVGIYGQGSGTQVFSTSFVQWSAREILRRAEPVSLVARFGPRQRQRGMNEMFAHPATEMDNAGSLVDADFAAYYTWINLNRLAGSENAAFIAWSESQQQAVAIGPGLPRGTVAPNPVTMEQLLAMAAPVGTSAVD
jgi:hypothetical protein